MKLEPATQEQAGNVPGPPGKEGGLAGESHLWQQSAEGHLWSGHVRPCEALPILPDVKTAHNFSLTFSLSSHAPTKMLIKPSVGEDAEKWNS